MVLALSLIGGIAWYLQCGGDEDTVVVAVEDLREVNVELQGVPGTEETNRGAPETRQTAEGSDPPRDDGTTREEPCQRRGTI